MSYHWKPESGDFALSELEAADALPEFDNQELAEAWLTRCFEDMLAWGVTAVSLYEEDRLVYGPMSLEA